MLSDLVRLGVDPSNARDLLDQIFAQTRTAMVVTDPNRADHPIVAVNAAFGRLTGYDEAEVVGRNCRFLQGPDTDRGEVARVSAAIRDRRVAAFELVNYRKDGTPFWNALHLVPIHDREGRLLHFFGSMWDATDKVEAVRALRGEVRLMDARLQGAIDEAGRLRDAVDQARDAMILTSYAPIDPPGPRIEWVNRGFERMTGWSADEVIGRTPRIFQGPETDRASLDGVRAALEAGRPFEARTINYKRDGTPFHLEWSIAPITDVAGTPTHWLSVQRDVTDSFEAGRRLELLNAELGHRQKNLFTLVGALQNGIPRQERSAEDYHRDLTARMKALAGAHDAVFSGDARVATMAELVRRALAPFSAAQVEADGEPATLSPAESVNVALLLHELATNAAKHGALSVPGGRVRLTWELHDGMLWLDWREAGGPEAHAPSHRGFGRKLIDMLSRGGGARPDAGLAFEPGGVVCRAAVRIA